MLILHISPSYYPHIGGVEYVVKLVVKRLAKKGHEITIIVEN
jgi:glycosyltransferase involved in cell wall biosynthesis